MEQHKFFIYSNNECSIQTEYIDEKLKMIITNKSNKKHVTVVFTKEKAEEFLMILLNNIRPVMVISNFVVEVKDFEPPRHTKFLDISIVKYGQWAFYEFFIDDIYFVVHLDHVHKFVEDFKHLIYE